MWVHSKQSWKFAVGCFDGVDVRGVVVLCPFREESTSEHMGCVCGAGNCGRADFDRVGIFCASGDEGGAGIAVVVFVVAHDMEYFIGGTGLRGGGVERAGVESVGVGEGE